MKEILLSTKGFVAIVDDEDFKWLSQWRWHLHNSGYAVRNEYLGGGRKNKKFKSVYMHRTILNSPPGVHTDHKNGIRLDNRRENLRLCNYTENVQNRAKSQNKSSKYKGVSFKKREQRWIATITINGKPKYLKSCKTEKEAALIYNAAALEAFGEFARLNQIE